jgi:hypothetical protein
MDPLVKGLRWPIVTLLVIGGSHLLAEALRPQLSEVVVPAVVMPIYLVVGAWGAIETRRAGGFFIHGLVAGVVLGLFPAMLQIVGFGLILGREADAVTTSAAFGFIAIFWAGAIGTGIAATQGFATYGEPVERLAGSPAASSAR